MTGYRRNTQPFGQRLSADARKDQIRAGLADGSKSLAELAVTMTCSATLVAIYAEQMSEVIIERQFTQTRNGSRQKKVLRLVGVQP